jgi:integrase
MAVTKARRFKRDPSLRCTSWCVVIYDPNTHKQDWYTVEGTKAEAQAFERQQRERLRRGVYVSRTQRMTLKQLTEAFIKEREARARRTSTIDCYETVFHKWLLVDAYALAQSDVGALRRNDFGQLFEAMRDAGASASTINRTLTAAKALMFFALERELIERNPLQRFRPFQRTATDRGRRVNRGAYSESEVRALLAAARAHERALLGLLALAGLRPGEVYALRASDLDLTGGAVRVARSWDHRGGVFVNPKTEARIRTAPLAAWLCDELRAHVEREALEGDALLFSTARGNPYNLSNVRRDIWRKVVERAGVRPLDMYSLRHTFASLARSSGEAAFNVARALGHARSTLVDQVYAHSLQSGLASVAAGVSARVFGKPRLTVIEGGAAAAGARDIRQALDD